MRTTDINRCKDLIRDGEIMAQQGLQYPERDEDKNKWAKLADLLRDALVTINEISLQKGKLL